MEVKREINPELVEQATAQDEEFRLREGDGEQNSRNEDNGLAASLSWKRSRHVSFTVVET